MSPVPQPSHSPRATPRDAARSVHVLRRAPGGARAILGGHTAVSAPAVDDASEPVKSPAEAREAAAITASCSSRCLARRGMVSDCDPATLSRVVDHGRAAGASAPSAVWSASSVISSLAARLWNSFDAGIVRADDHARRLPGERPAQCGRPAKHRSRELAARDGF